MGKVLNPGAMLLIVPNTEKETRPQNEGEWHLYRLTRLLPVTATTTTPV